MLLRMRLLHSNTAKEGSPRRPPMRPRKSKSTGDNRSSIVRYYEAAGDDPVVLFAARRKFWSACSLESISAMATACGGAGEKDDGRRKRRYASWRWCGMRDCPSLSAGTFRGTIARPNTQKKNCSGGSEGSPTRRRQRERPPSAARRRVKVSQTRCRGALHASRHARQSRSHSTALLFGSREIEVPLVAALTTTLPRLAAQPPGRPPSLHTLRAAPARVKHCPQRTGQRPLEDEPPL